MKQSKRLLTLLLVLSMLLSCIGTAFAAEGSTASVPEQTEELNELHLTDRIEVLEPDAVETADPNEMVRVSIVLEKPPTIEKGYATANIAANKAAMAYNAELKSAQHKLENDIEKKVLAGAKLDVVWNLTLAANLISANVRAGDIETIRDLPGVKAVVRETQYKPAVVSTEETDPQMSTSNAMIGSTAAWLEGYYGAGGLIAVIDTGFDSDHQSFNPSAFDYAIAQYEEEMDLLTAEDIDAVLTRLNAYQRSPNLTAASLYKSTKNPYGYNYIDRNSFDITHDNDNEGEHGSHVAGIAAANRFIPDGKGGYADALDAVMTQGVAPDAQVLVMKVFGQGGGAFDSDYMAAIEDAIFLGADSINLSLGSSVAGNAHNDLYEDLLNSLTETNSLVVASSGNTGSWAEEAGSNAYQVYGTGYLYSDDINFQTSGTPAAYTNSLAVASADNIGFTGNYITVADENIFYTETTGFRNPAFTKSAGTYEFVYLDSVGVVANAEGTATLEDQLALLGAVVDLKGKILLCNRGVSTFAAKANAAAAQGAAGVIIVNNEAGTINMDLTDYKGNVPVASVTQADGELFKGNEGGTIRTSYRATGAFGNSRITYYTGTVTVSAVIGVDPGQTNDEGLYDVSEFSSWGVPGDLSLKPEITAPGGNIYSVNGAIPGGKAYENMSGTSMAAPQVSGMTALLAQRIRKDGLEKKTDVSARVLMQSLLMSTAQPMRDAEAGGSYYSLLAQGAGLADIGEAVRAQSFILMDDSATASAADGKVKVELGDDPQRSGVYDYSFTLHNLSDTARSYILSTDVFTQEIWYDVENSGADYLDTWTTRLGATVTYKVDGSSQEAGCTADVDRDGDTDDQDAQAILDYLAGTKDGSACDLTAADMDKDGTVSTYDAHLLLQALKSNTITLPAGGSVSVAVRITVDKEQLAAYENGAYIEGYTYVKSIADAEGTLDVTHSIPIFGFYGNWTDASMFDYGTGEQAYYDELERYPYLYDYTGGMSNYATVNIGGSTYYLFNNDTISANTILGSINYSLIRNAGSGVIRITDHNDPTKVYYTSQELSTDAQLYAAHFNAESETWVNYRVAVTLNRSLKELANLTDSAVVDISLVMAPEYYADENGHYDWNALTDRNPENGELGKGAYLTTTVIVDSEAPEILNVRYERVASDSDNLHIFVEAKDNASVNSIALYGNDGDKLLYQYHPAIYVYQNGNFVPSFNPTGPNEIASAEFDGAYVLGYINDGIKEEYMWGLDRAAVLEPGVYQIEVMDAAGNTATQRLLVETDYTYDVEAVQIYDESGEPIERLNLMKNSTRQLTGRADPASLADRSVTWTSADTSIARVDKNGVVTGLKAGTTTLTAASTLDPTKTATVEVTVESLEKHLNAVIWDDTGKLWWSDIDTAAIPNYTKLAGPIDNSTRFLALAYGPDNRLYGSTYERNGSYVVSDFYSIDPVTYSATKIGGSKERGYMDLAETHSLGRNYMISIYGTYVMLLNTRTGDADAAFDYTEGGAELVGVAYEGTFTDKQYGLTWDMYFLIDNEGNIYEEAFAYDASSDLFYYYFGKEYALLGSTGLGLDGNTWFENSAYYDGRYLFWSRFSTAEDDVDLIAIDFGNISNSGNAAIYDLGSFDKGVWPVAGLIELSGPLADRLGTPTVHNDLSAAAPKVMPNDAVAPISVSDEDNGKLNAIAVDGTTGSNGTKKYDVVDVNAGTVTVKINASESTNGLFTAKYDPDVLTLKRVDGLTGYYAYNDGKAGEVIFDYAAADALTQQVAKLVFTIKKYDVTTSIDVIFTEDGSNLAVGTTERIPVDIGKAFLFDDVTNKKSFYFDPVYWAYYHDPQITTGTSKTLFSPEAGCTRGQVVTFLWRAAGCPEPKSTKTPFTDVTGGYYKTAVAWAVEEGITNGITKTEFKPDDTCTRGQIVTFLWRFAKSPAPTTTKTDFVDLKPKAYYENAVLWAVEKGITSGVNKTEFKPDNTCTRGQVVTFLYRLMEE